MPVYTLAALCKRGHIISLNAGRPDQAEPEYCTTCGATVLRACAACDSPLLGVERIADEWGGLDTGGWVRPSFCYSCGAPYPWVDRIGRIHHLENLLDREDLAEGTELAVRERLEALADPDLDDKTAERHWLKVRELAPGLWEKSGARAVATSLMTQALKQALGL